MVSGVSILAGVPILYVGLIVARYSLNWCYFLTFVDGEEVETCSLRSLSIALTLTFVHAGLLLNCIFAIVSDMTLYVVVPTRRSFASATQILVSHALGDAISPYLMGVMADWIRPAISPGGGPGDGAAGVGAFGRLRHDMPVLGDELVSGRRAPSCLVCKNNIK